MRSLKTARFIFGFSLIAALFLAGTAGFFVGKSYSAGESRTVDGADFNLFWQAYDQLKTSYLGEIDPQKFVYGAISGAFESLGDPYTNFFTPSLTDEFQQELSGQLEGIGLKLGQLDKFPAVIAPIENSPAQKAGLRAKDIILKVDDFETESQPLDLVVSKIRGSAGTKVKLLVQQASTGQIKEFELIREKIEVKSVEVKYQNSTAIISISEFGTNTLSDFDEIYKQANERQVKNVILDLRNNPGGLLEGSIEIAEYFLNKGQVIVIEESKKLKLERKARTERGWQKVNLAVLVNEGSASASEILAGALKDNNRSKIYGEKTFGKGVVQEFIALSGGSSVKITVSKWLTPSGTEIDKNGLTPDIEVKNPDATSFDTDDPVLDRALNDFK